MIESDVVVAIKVAESLSRELDDDYVEFWSLLWHLRRALPDADDQLLRTLSQAILTALTDSNVALGDLDGKTGTFLPWDNPSTSVATAMSMWQDLGRDPNMGDIGWLARTR
ncbi:hypothetical protein JOD54_003132 [Actinokineospora baliensis]|uniref:hypothetical protein n=1 Tax=Actinokineospora baliensis TaxID=547056 RepID=UPI00195D66CB|nr:hypothetical protein [Actinokineospora baliensis]MBM7772928.1 hypothetical protein [Actinokineospora baliensis]